MVHIAIERECGSGGTQIAEKLAERCGVPCYGVEILQAVSAVLDMPVEHIRKNEETVTNSFLYSLLMLSKAQNGEGSVLSDTGKIFVEEQKIIKEFSRQGSAIFLGHCASEALRDSASVITVFIHADDESKKERISRLYGVPEKSVQSFRRENDRRRSSYYYANTRRKWDDYRSYDIVIDSTAFGVERCVDILEGIFKGGKNGT